MKEDYQKKILIFGVGLSGRAVFRKLNQEADFKIIGFVDNFYNENNNFFFNKKVYSPSQISLIEYDLIVLSGRDIDEIKNQLLDDLRIPENKFLILTKSDLMPSDIVREYTEESIIEILTILTNMMNNENISYWMDFSALLAIHRKVDFSNFSDVDIAINSQNDAKSIFDAMSKFKQFKLKKKLIDEKLNYAKIGDIMQISIESSVDLLIQEPAIIDIHLKFLHDDIYKCPVGKYSLYTPFECLNGYEVIKYKNLPLRIPLNSKGYLELIYGKFWEKPIENWKSGDYGNILDE